MYNWSHTYSTYKARPLLTSTHVINRFKIVALETSVRASGDTKFQRV